MQQGIRKQAPHLAVAHGRARIAEQKKKALGAQVLAARQSKEEKADGNDGDRDVGEASRVAPHEVDRLLPFVPAAFDNLGDVLGGKAVGGRKVATCLLQLA
jgi:hypothetical protein